jgi:TrmH family RNA methyltransferase
MLSKNKIKFITALKKKKYRNETGLFVAEGTKLVEEIIDSGFMVSSVFALSEWINSLNNKNQSNVNEIIAVTQKELEKISSQKNPNQVLAVVEKPHHEISVRELENDITLLLDRINDPGNLGTILRVADWFGIKNVICSTDTVDVYNPKVIQSTMGSICRVKVHYRELAELLKEYQANSNVPVYGSFLEGRNIFQENLSRNGFIVLGSESHGIADALTPYIKNRLYIPGFPFENQKVAESLNVSVAAGIICAEFRRRNQTGSDYSK